MAQVSAMQKVLAAATAEFSACPSWKPVLAAAWEEIGQRQGKYVGWGKDVVELWNQQRAT